jgi:UDPglucose--hexose-1-phosphate uridylyltransferase
MSEFRQDLVSGDWIVMAPERGKRPHDLIKKKKNRRPSPKTECPFENLQLSGNWPPLLSSPSDANWRAVIVPNKYPALMHSEPCPQMFHQGPYAMVAGIGHHDLVITRDHDKNFAHMSLSQILATLELIQQRFFMLHHDRCLVYSSVFSNWGPLAGASFYHPHMQMLTLPIIPPDVGHSLRGSERYWRDHHRCVHCVMTAYEKKEKVRIIEETKDAIVVAPFVSRSPYEVRIFPKTHEPYFEKASRATLRSTAAMLQSTLRRFEKFLGDPDVNFFIHTAPIQSQRSYTFYHWHIEVLPKIAISAGFELSTGVDINTVQPELTALVLRGKSLGKI